MTKINIGTTKKNLVGVTINKSFDNINYNDIKNIVLKEFGTLDKINIIGWCDVTNEK